MVGIKLGTSQQIETLIVADDGSTDGTLEWLCEELEIEDYNLVVIRNDSLGIARQTNSIIDYVSNLHFRPDAIFMCNDDIRFLKRIGIIHITGPCQNLDTIT